MQRERRQNLLALKSASRVKARLTVTWEDAAFSVHLLFLLLFSRHFYPCLINQLIILPRRIMAHRNIYYSDKYYDDKYEYR